MDIWQQCKERATHQTLDGTLIRVVESQEQVATNNLVETLDEQLLLEQMLETNKPAKKHHSHNHHYLLATPFRYPPLRYGSRFGSKSEPSLFYGSLSLTTALSETAYYRFMFWRGMTTPPPQKIITQHTVFSARYHTAQGFRLQEMPFDEYRQQLSAPCSYSASQQLGKALRELGTQAIEFIAARDTTTVSTDVLTRDLATDSTKDSTTGSTTERVPAINVALFSPLALPERLPGFQQQWLCETQDDAVAFYSGSKKQVYSFSLAQFLVDGAFPQPGNAH